MSKKLLVFSWEFPEVCSRQGTALARRVGQVANDFVRNGWEVIVVHKDQIEEVKTGTYNVYNINSSLSRVSIKGPALNEYNSWEKFSLFRQISTMVTCFLYGDRSYRWAKKTKQIIKELLPREKYSPDLIIGFFTPRAPLILGKQMSEYYHTSWVADFQDSFDEGYDAKLLPFVRRWTKRIIRSAKSVTHVSPEWSKRDGDLLDISIHVIRHALPLIEKESEAVKNDSIKKEYNILYLGSLDEKNQSIELFAEVYNTLLSEGVNLKLKLAGNEYLKRVFESAIPSKKSIEYLGWLNKKSLAGEVAKADILLVIPWSTAPRQVIPSKFFELAPMGKPIAIIGKDTGSFRHLINDVMHPEIKVDNKEFHLKAFQKAMSGNYESFFDLQKCRRPLLRENELYREFLTTLK